MCLAGFSQGGAMSLFTGLQLPKEQRLAGVLVMSGYLAGANTFALTAEHSDVPVLHQHGTADPMVLFDWAKETQQKVQTMGHSNYELKVYEGMEHEVSLAELTHGVNFLHKVLAKASADQQA
jgi:lysophospholipase-2